MKKFLIAIVALLISLPMASAQTQLEPKKASSGKWGYCKAEQWVIPARFEHAASFAEGVACVCLNGKFGYINVVGEVVIPYRFDSAFSFTEGLAAVTVNGKWGFINHAGEAVIPYRFDSAKSFAEGLAPVYYNGKWGFVDREGVCKIPYQYENANCFSDGLASVRRNGKSGYIDNEAKWYDTKSTFIPKFSDYAKRFVEERINKWQLKGKYEKTAAWKERVNEQTRRQKIDELTRIAEQNYINDMKNNVAISQRLFDYDADNENFLIKDDNFGDLLIPVPIADAPRFEEEFYTMKRTVRYFIENDKLGLAEMTFVGGNNKKFTYNNQASLDFFITHVDYNFAAIEIDQKAVERMQRGEQKISYANLSTMSDIDVNIPKSKTANENTYAVIIANELYKNEQSVPYAKTDGESFRNYCINTLGITDERRIHFCTDATLNEMRQAVRFLENIGSSALGESANIIFYYSGHGVPDDASRAAFLLPTDGSGNDPESGYPLDQLYTQLGNLPVRSVVVMLDACFSGAKRDGDMLVASRGVAIVPRSTAPSGNTIVFAATTGDETAALYPQQGHGLFTYFLLKKLQESKGECSLGELADYVSKEVNKESVLSNRRQQTPTVIASPMMNEVWRKMKLK